MLKSEPVLIIAVVQAGITLAAAFGFNLTAQQTAAIATFTGALLAVFARSQVTPTPKV